MRDLAEKLLGLAQKKIEKSSVLKLITAVMRSNDLQGVHEILLNDESKWRENVCLHFFAFASCHFGLDTSIGFFLWFLRM